MSSNKLADTTALVTAMVENSARLGLTWAIRFGTVDSIKGGITYVILDGDPSTATAQPAVPLTVQPATNARITAFITSATDIFIIGVDPSPGKPVIRWRRTAALAVADNTTVPIPWDTSDLDLFDVFVSGGTNFLPPIEGWFWMNGRGVFAANATSRRYFFIIMNSTGTSVGGASVQTPATGAAQVGGGGLAYFNGNTDFAGGVLLQNSGVSINTASNDGGCLLEAVYLGSPVTT